MPVGSMILTLHLPGNGSLKGKRHIIKPLIARLHKEFNLSIAEVDMQDHWQIAVLQLAMVSSDARLLETSLDKVGIFIEANWPDLMITDSKTELL